MSISEALFREHFWDIISNGLPAVNIPIYIKNILALSGYDCIPVLRKFDAERFNKLEDFVRNKMRVLIESPLDTDEDKKCYYHLYYKIPSQFEIVEGHKELIMEISRFVDSCIKNNGSNFFNQQQETPAEIANKLENILKAKQQEILLNVDDLCDSLFNKIRNWIVVKKFDNIYPLMDPSMIVVDVIENDDEESVERFSYSATILCPVCQCVLKAKYKSYKSKGHNYNRARRWYDNFDRHIIEKHSPDGDQMDNLSRTPRKRKMEVIQIEYPVQTIKTEEFPSGQTTIKMEESFY